MPIFFYLDNRSEKKINFFLNENFLKEDVVLSRFALITKFSLVFDNHLFSFSFENYELPTVILIQASYNRVLSKTS